MSSQHARLKALKSGLLAYNTLLLYSLSTAWLLATNFNYYPWLVLLVIAPLGIHYTLALSTLVGKHFVQDFYAVELKVQKVLGMYSATFISLVFFVMLSTVSHYLELLYVLSLVPVLFYHWFDFLQYWYRQLRLIARVITKLLFKKKTREVAPTPKEEVVLESTPTTTEDTLVPVLEQVPQVNTMIKDVDRRQFLKLLGGTSFGIMAVSLFMPQKANAAFFGSAPGPGVVALKDSSGTKIDPKEKSPTDGFNITEIDDNALPSYYGFVNKDGAWYISKEDSSGSYRYAKGSSNFSLSWTGRALLSYDYFDVVFS